MQNKYADDKWEQQFIFYHELMNNIDLFIEHLINSNPYILKEEDKSSSITFKLKEQERRYISAKHISNQNSRFIYITSKNKKFIFNQCFTEFKKENNFFSCTLFCYGLET